MADDDSVSGEMSEGTGSRRGVWVTRLLLAGGLVMVATHVFVASRLLAHVALPAAVVVAALVLIVLRHLGILGPLYRRWSRRPAD